MGYSPSTAMSYPGASLSHVPPMHTPSYTPMPSYPTGGTPDKQWGRPLDPHDPEADLKAHAKPEELAEHLGPKDKTPPEPTHHPATHHPVSMHMPAMSMPMAHPMSYPTTSMAHPMSYPTTSMAAPMSHPTIRMALSQCCDEHHHLSVY